MFWVWLQQLFSSGKKYNPLRDRVDSADCSVEQLFLGDPSIFIFILFLLFLHTTKAYIYIRDLKSGLNLQLILAPGRTDILL